MALIKKIDVDNYFAAKRTTRLDRISLVSKPIAIVAESDKRPADDTDLIGNYTPETFSSSASIPITPASIPITFDSGRNRLLRPPGNR